MLEKILELLIAQVGYKESGTNITKYAEYFDTAKAKGGAWQFFNTKKQGAEWCALLILWAFCQVLGTDETREFLGLPKPADNCAAGCKYFCEYLTKKGYKVAKSKGQVGGIIFFNTKSAKCGHVGFIEKVDADKYYTIEGNKSNAVKRASYSKNSTSIYAICQPDYATLTPIKEDPKTEPKQEPTKSIDQLALEVINGMWGNGDDRKKRLTDAGYDYSAVQKKVNEMLGKTSASSDKPKTDIYVVKTFTGAPLNLRSQANTSAKIITTMKNGSFVEVLEIKNGWAKVKYSGKIGYCTANRLSKK